MLNLVQNENMKIYRRVRTWILLGVLVAVVCLLAIVVKNASGALNDKNWKEQVQQQVMSDKKMLEGPDMPAFAKEQVQAEMKVGEYRLEHNIQPPDNTLWGGMQQPVTLALEVLLMTIFTVIIAADIVASEFAGGTIKLLLIRPARRSKVLFSKYLATLLFCVVLLAVLFSTSFLMNLILYGPGEVGLPYLYASKDGVVHQSNMVLHVLSTYGLNCVKLIMIVTMAFMISSVFRSSAMAISLSLVALFVGEGVLALISKYDWSKYYLFANTNLTAYIEGQPFKPGMTMGFSISVLVVYFVIFNLLSWTIFSKRDVAA